jgi:hypothetical protein
VQRVPVLAGLASALKPSALAGWMEMREWELSSVLRPAVPRLVLQGEESEQWLEAE